jgi:hypothetical protein
MGLHYQIHPGVQTVSSLRFKYSQESLRLPLFLAHSSASDRFLRHRNNLNFSFRVLVIRTLSRIQIWVFRTIL